MKTWMTLTTFAISLMVIGFAGTTPSHAGPVVINKGDEKLKCMENLKSFSDHCRQITALKPLDAENNAQSAAAEQNPETFNNRNAGIEPGGFSLAQQFLMETMFDSHINEAFTDIALLEPAVPLSGDFSLVGKIGYFNFNNALGTNEPFGMNEPFLFQFGADTEIMKVFETEQQ